MVALWVVCCVRRSKGERESREWVGFCVGVDCGVLWSCCGCVVHMVCKECVQGELGVVLCVREL